jgi:hypothetical protein
VSIPSLPLSKQSDVGLGVRGEKDAGVPQADFLGRETQTTRRALKRIVSPKVTFFLLQIRHQ